MLKSNWPQLEEFSESPYRANQYCESPDSHYLAVIHEIDEVRNGQYNGRFNVLIAPQKQIRRFFIGPKKTKFFLLEPDVEIIGEVSCGFLPSGPHVWFCQRFGSQRVLYASILDLEKEQFALALIPDGAVVAEIHSILSSREIYRYRWFPMKRWKEKYQLVHEEIERVEERKNRDQPTWRDYADEASEKSYRKYSNMKIKDLLALIEKRQFDDSQLIWRVVGERGKLKTCKVTLLRFLERSRSIENRFQCARALLALVFKEESSVALTRVSHQGEVAIRHHDLVFSPHTLGSSADAKCDTEHLEALTKLLDGLSEQKKA